MREVNKKRMIFLLVVGIILSIFTISAAAEWGIIMYPRSKTTIRAKRSVKSKVKGQLNAGQPVKADFLRDSWYAVFKVTETRRSEARALGYVLASRLQGPGSKAPGAPSHEEKSSGGVPSKTEMESLLVDIKNITFKIVEDGKECIFIEFDRFYTPAISTIQGEAPRIVLGVTNVSSLRKEWAVIYVGGKLIRQIRSSMNPQTHVAQIVLDMETSKDYYVNPVFYEKENTYSLEVFEEKKIQTP